jgi:hypothetical protein
MDGDRRRLNSAEGSDVLRPKSRWTKQKVFELLALWRSQGEVDRHARRSTTSAPRTASPTTLRADGRIYRDIADELNRQDLRPLKRGAVQQASQDLLRSAVFADRSNPRGLALYLKEQGHSLREIGLRLAQAGHFPKRGGQWYPQTVKLLFVS